MSLGTYMAALDSSIINISMPTLTTFFNSEISTTNWIVTSYLLTLSGSLLVFGRLSDVIGRKSLFTLGMIVFTISSAACGMSPTLTLLIISRILQAIGGAMIMSISPAIITEVFSPKERGKALGSIGTVVALGIMTGSPLGGAIVSSLSWRYIFFINIPVGIIGTIASLLVLQKKGAHEKIRKTFDFLGAGALVIFMVTFLLAVTIGVKKTFFETSVYLLLITSVLFFIIFIVTELKVKHPTIELQLFNNSGFSSANMSALLTYMSIFMLIFIMPFFLERIQGLRPDIIGAILITPTFMLLVLSPFFGWVSDKIGYRLLRCTGLSIITVAFLSLSHINADTTILNIVLKLLLYGFGVGMFISPNNSLLMGSVPKNKLGVAAGMLATTRNIGMLMGVSTASAIFTYRLKYYGSQSQELHSPLELSHMPYSDVFFCAAIFAGLGVIIAYLQGKRVA
ncbi:MFS transporter [Thermodesulfobacteriota bacterium]